MKKFLLGSMLLSVMALAACGDDSSTSDAKDVCTDDPAQCEIQTPDPEPAE